MPLRRDKHPRYKIKTLSEQLRKLSFPRSPISLELATFAADAFDKFLTGTCSLEAAFGLGGKPGVRGHPKARLKLAKAVRSLRKAGHSWKRVLDELSQQGFGFLDLSTVKRTYKEFYFRLAARDIAQTLNPDNDLISPTKIRKTKARG